MNKIFARSCAQRVAAQSALKVRRPLSMAPTPSMRSAMPMGEAMGNETEAERVTRSVVTEMNLADKYGAPDVHLDSKKDSTWYLWRGNIWVKPLRFEAKTGTYVIALKTSPACQLGKHRHRGPVTAYTVKGSWGYDEYNWTSRTGDYVVENPGTIHTLNMGADTEVVFTVAGSIEFFEDDGKLREIMDLFSFWRMYVEHCETKSLPINEGLWF